MINGIVRDDYVFKKGPTYSNQKKEFFNNLGISIYEIWENEIRSNNYSVLSSNLDYDSIQPTSEHLISEIHTDDVDFLDLELIGLNRYVKDIDGSFVKIKKVIKNKNVSDWLLIELKNG